jgi:hypothetical protein
MAFNAVTTSEKWLLKMPLPDFQVFMSSFPIEVVRDADKETPYSRFGRALNCIIYVENLSLARLAEEIGVDASNLARATKTQTVSDKILRLISDRMMFLPRAEENKKIYRAALLVAYFQDQAKRAGIDLNDPDFKTLITPDDSASHFAKEVRRFLSQADKLAKETAKPGRRISVGMRLSSSKGSGATNSI